MSNQLADASSPYLQQHAHQKIHWYTWGEEAFNTAFLADKPIFLSIGYASCHWCHVMSHESFDDEEITALLNQHFIAIKLDREERPDLDATYMLVTQLITGQGGWPNSLFLTPDKKPWYAGTYFPKEDSPNRVGFKTLLADLAHSWKTRREDINAQSEELTRVLSQMGAQKPAQKSLSLTSIKQSLTALFEVMDTTHGGLGGAPKFPPHSTFPFVYSLLKNASTHPGLQHLIDNHTPPTDSDPSYSLRHFCTHTLTTMRLEGIYDHVGGGFHRYATDAIWRVPHFEKMLYDNALMLAYYADAYALFKDPLYAQTIREIITFCQDVLGDETGGYCSGLDADSEGEEGLYYLWSYDEISPLISTDTNSKLSLSKEGNFNDELTGKPNGLNLIYFQNKDSSEDPPLGLPKADQSKLLEKRQKRTLPFLDTKILCDWNSLLCTGFAKTAVALFKDYPEDAKNAFTSALSLESVLQTQFSRSDDSSDTPFKLYHCLSQPSAIDGFLEDYAYYAQALLNCHEMIHRLSSLAPDWITAAAEEKELSTEGLKAYYLDRAQLCIDAAIHLFWDEENAGFFMSTDAHDGLIRPKDGFDQALPSGNGILAQAMMQWITKTQNSSNYHAYLARLFQSFTHDLTENSRGLHALFTAYVDYLGYFNQNTQDPSNGAIVSLGTLQNSISSNTPVTLTLHILLPPKQFIQVGNDKHPFEITLTEGPFTLDFVDMPVSSKRQVAFSDTPLDVLSGEITCQLQVSLKADAKISEKERQSLSIHLGFEACNDTQCLPYSTHTLPYDLYTQEEGL